MDVSFVRVVHGRHSTRAPAASKIGRRLVALTVALVQLALLAPGVFRALPAMAAATCSLGPGKDGSPGTLSGAYNTYYQPPLGTLSAGTTSVPLGAIDVGGGGANTAVAANDLLLIVQMQDGSFSSINSSAYGNGSGSGYTSLGQAGLYEYVAVVSVAAGTATIIGGSGGGLLNTYTETAATGVAGQRTYQIIRVPQYVDATLSSTFRAGYWDGKTGGVAALDIASTLNLGGANIYATGNGFRGGGLTVSSTSPASALNTDWAASATMNGPTNANPPAYGSKGEGIVGSPDYLFEYTSFTTPSTPASPTVINGAADGYPGGDQGKGAPGNAGGGGTDYNPAANDENTGGGGGANGGSGGNGGYPWTPVGYSSGNNPSYYVDSPGQHTATSTTSAPPDATHNPDLGGRGGGALTPSVTRLFMGGGGGAGSNNNASNNNGNGSLGSSGGVGGGMVLIRIAYSSGTAATVYADGTTGLAPDNDGGGGGGAGGTVEVTSPNAFAGLTVHADGAAGTTAASTGSDTTYNIQHGPGGGGGGGAVLTSSAVTATVNGGANGTTTSYATAYGATSGTSGTIATVNASQIPGVASGAECWTGVGGNVLTGPVGANGASGSYDGVAVTNIDNDFTAKGFFPAGATLGNTGTVPGTYIGTTISQGPTTVDVRNEVYANNTGGPSRTVTITATAPTSPAGWTAQVCRDNAGAISCATGGGFTVGTAGATSSGSFAVSGHTAVTTQYWVRYGAPTGLTAFARYDAPIFATDNAATPNMNWTHNELYPGYIVLTKQMTIQSTGCSGSVPAGTVCPGGVILWTIDYRDIIAGGASESGVAGAYPATTGGSLVVTEDGTATWGTTSNGLADVLVAGATCSGTSYGDTSTGTTFTNGTVGSKLFTATIGGASGTVTPVGATTGIHQGKICFRVTVK